MISIAILILFSCQMQSQARSDFDRLPKSLVDYRYFVEEFGDVYKIIDSCAKIKNTSQKSRCVVRINNDRIITILTAFHVIVPQVTVTFKSFIGFYLITIVFIILPTMIYIQKINPEHLKKISYF